MREEEMEYTGRIDHKCGTFIISFPFVVTVMAAFAVLFAFIYPGSTSAGCVPTPEVLSKIKVEVCQGVVIEASSSLYEYYKETAPLQATRKERRLLAFY